jgi:putative transposase
VRFAFIQGNRDRFDVSVMCAVLEVTTAGFYAWLKRPLSRRDLRARELSEQIRIVHREVDGIYGSIKVARELRARNHRVNRKTVARLMAQMGLRSRVSRRFRVRTTDSRHDNPVAPNTLDRNFAVADAPGKVWAADITYIPTGEGVLYLAGVMDLFSRRIVGWSMKDTMATDLVEDALNAALLTRKPSSSGLLHHSDRGVQYTSARYRQRLHDAGVELSMSRRGDCYDNAVVESFWGKLKSEMVYHRKFATMVQARAAIFDYIEGFYNRKRLHASLGYLSPEQFEAARCS